MTASTWLRARPTLRAALMPAILVRRSLLHFARLKAPAKMLQAVPYDLSSNPSMLDRFHAIAKWRAKNYIKELDPLRIAHFMRLLRDVANLPEGDYIEMGTQYGGTAKMIWSFMNNDRSLYCFDTFQGFLQADLDKEVGVGGNHGFTTESITPLGPEKVRRLITDGIESDRLSLVPGRVPESLAPYSNMRWRFAHLDMDLYEPTRGAIAWLWPRMVPGGIVFFHDYDCLPGVRKAVDDFLRPLGLSAVPLSDRFGSAVVYTPTH